MIPSRAPFLALLLLAGCGGADVVVSPNGTTVTVSPLVATLQPGQSTTFSAMVGGTKNQGVTWSVVGGANNGAFQDATGVYTAPFVAGTYTVVATSTENTGKAGSAMAVVVQPVVVTVTPSSVTLAPNATQLFSAAVSGAGNQAVTWAVQGEGEKGAFTGTSGLYTAPALSGTFTVVATSVSDPNRVGTATIHVDGPVTVTVSPAQVNLLPGGTQTFTATVEGATPTTVEWSVVGTNSGTIDSVTGAYTAPPIAGTFTVKATNRSDGVTEGTAKVTVSQVGLSITPDTITLDQGASQVFQPTVTGTTNPSITWSVVGADDLTQIGPYLYTASSGAGSYVLKGIPAADPNVFATAAITINPVIVSTLTPLNAVVPTRGTILFNATVTGTTNKATTWSVSTGGAGGTINQFGVYTAPLVVGTDTVVVTATADASAYRIALVTVGSVAISPAYNSAQVAGVGTITFSATVTGVSDPGVTWSILPAPNGGTITNVGFFTAPTSPGIYRVRATSTVNSALFAEVSVTVIAGP